ncbi:nicotinic acetylcholine receptor alpha 12 subunit precursor [Nasonia vitripennis]|uniref:Nicotinic acetylcholine receptor subunit alpha 12 n=2 Tax=Nasonia vitripennis TaxID=7425 RepID=D3UA24_NASVI|nr:nicotinic acetylcholine receptor alpha 12 subunit precursor [Nasonia vitripennis]ACY82697.1 nicotinic acetylcholine receptor subunit alpha 12 [Nasonia vitripennis]
MIRHILFLAILLPIISSDAVLPKPRKVLTWNETWVDRLRRNLLLKYDKFARPTQHYNTTTLFVYLNIMHVELDNKKNTMSVNTWVRMSWNDEKLKWDPKDYGGVKEVSVSIHEIWQPDLYLYNSAVYGVENYESRHCIVRQDGEVTWVAPTVFHSYCEFNYVLWPFETNTCVLNIGSWTHNGYEIDIRLQEAGFDLHYYSAGEWKVKNVTAHRRVKVYSCCAEPYIVLDYEIKMTRSSELYYHVIFVASIPIISLILVTFWLRPQSEMKLLLNICAVTIDILFLLYFGYKVPARINNLPLIVRFFSGCLCQMSVSIIVSAFVIHVSSSSFDIPIPRRIRNQLYGKLGRYLGLRNVIREIESQKLAEFEEIHDNPSPNLGTSDLSISGLDNGDQQCIISQSRNVKRLEWILLATAVDRFFFILFCSIFSILAIAYVRVGSDAFSKSFNIMNISPSSASENITGIDFFEGSV